MNFGTPGMEAVPIIWYWVDEDAGQLDRATPFCSRNYQALNKGEGGPLGEVIGADRPWRNGATPFASASSNRPCGTASQWRGETPVADVSLFFGFPACCNPVSPPVVEVAASLVLGTQLFADAIAVSGGSVINAAAARGHAVSADLVAVGQGTRGHAVAASLGHSGSVATGPVVGADLVAAAETKRGGVLAAGLVLDGDRAYWPPATPITVECSMVLCGRVPIQIAVDASIVAGADTGG